MLTCREIDIHMHLCACVHVHVYVCMYTCMFKNLWVRKKSSIWCGKLFEFSCPQDFRIWLDCCVDKCPGHGTCIKTLACLHLSFHPTLSRFWPLSFQILKFYLFKSAFSFSGNSILVHPWI